LARIEAFSLLGWAVCDADGPSLGLHAIYERKHMLLALLILLLIIAIGGGIIISKFLFLVLLVAVAVAIGSRVGRAV
jgi:hypothetical protein